MINTNRQKLLEMMLQNQQQNINTPQSPFAAFLGSFAPAYGLSSMATEDEAQKKEKRRQLSDALVKLRGRPAEQNTFQDGTVVNWNAQKPDDTAIMALIGDEDVGDEAAALMKYKQDEDQFKAGLQEKQKDRDLRLRLARELASSRQEKSDRPPPLSGQAQKELLNISKKYGGDTVLEDALGRMEVESNKEGAEKPYSGLGADAASVAAKIPLLSEFVDPERLETTENLNKLADTLSLQYLESFGGSDTEREQKIARELSALGNMSPAQRRAAINTARKSLLARKTALQRQRDMILTDPSYRGGNPNMIIQDPQLSLGVLDE